MSIVRNDLQIIHPIEGLFLILPSDVNYFQKTRAIYVGTSGDLTVETANGSVITIPNMASGIFHPLQIIRVLSTGTDATGIIGGI